MKPLKILLIGIIVFLPLIAYAEYKSINDLAKAYSDEACKQCHSKIYDEWKSSYHSQSIIHSLPGLRAFIVNGLGKEWKKPVNREHLMRCMNCHAPQLKDASESLIRQISDLIVAAVDEKDEAKKEAAKKELAKFNVNCITCHNTKAIVEKNLRGEAQKDVYYSPAGKKSPAHKTEMSPAMERPLFCGQCHGAYTPPDGDVVICNTLYESYQNAYKANGGTETCQDCHMKKNNRGHTFPGAYQLDIVQEGIGLDAQIIGTKLHPGKWVPSVIANIGLINRAGHRIPDG
ncbi:MAG: multiheme c-type cytochrome ExtKL [Nitrospirota bacterium]